MLKRTHVLCIGAGPAGLTASYLLTKEGLSVTVLEADRRYVGGISRTVEHKGFRFDIGGHRFFSKSAEVRKLWQELLPQDLIERRRSSRIYFGGRFYPYPLRIVETLRNLGIWEAARCCLSYLKARALPGREPKHFEDWVCRRFGRRLFSLFFKTYTEKVWGMPCHEISADWAAQRIKDFSLWAALRHACSPARFFRGRKGNVIKTLIESFHYPRLGPGMMWEAAADRTREQGGEVRMGCRVTALRFDEDSAGWIVTFTAEDGREEQIHAKHVVSSAPLRTLVQRIQPPLPSRTSADRLKYRDFLMVALMLKERDRWSDNWLYIHDPGVKVGRIQNFKSWSPQMVPDPSLVCYGMEYFCFEGDGLWTSSDETLATLAATELQKLGLARRDEVIESFVVRQAKAYPVYDDVYVKHVDTIRADLRKHCPNLHVVGRNGMHKYNNQDHSMMTAMLTVQNILAGELRHDVWRVNQDAEYHEQEANEHVKEHRAGIALGTLRLVPVRG